MIIDALVPQPEQPLQHHRRRELGGTAEATAHLVELPLQLGAGLVQARDGDLAGQPRGVPLSQLTADVVGAGQHLVATVPPGGGDGVQHLAERGHAVPGTGREVGARVERATVRGEEHTHRPTTLAGQRLGRGHEHRVDVRPLLPVHLDRDEVGVQLVGPGRILERLVRHHVTPVAGRVPHRQEHRYVSAFRLRERLVAPRPPVHRVVGVLAQIGAGRVGQAVGHAVQPTTCSSRERTVPDRPSLDR